jgi:hypothetical protein
MMTKRSEYALAALMLFGMLAWMFYFGGLWHLIYFSYPIQLFALFLSVPGAVFCIRQLRFKPELTIRQQLFGLTIFLPVYVVVLFGAVLGILSIPVFFKKTTETHTFQFIEWRLGAYRATGNLKFHCSALVVAESPTHMPGRQHTICIDEFPTPRSRIGSIEVQISDLGYVALIRSARPPGATGIGSNKVPHKEAF